MKQLGVLLYPSLVGMPVYGRFLFPVSHPVFLPFFYYPYHNQCGKKKGVPPHPIQQDLNVWLKICFLLIPTVNFHHSMLLKSYHLIWRMHSFCGSTKSQQFWMKISWKSRSNMQNNFYRTKTKPNDSGFAVINCSQKCRRYFLWWKNFWKISVMGKVCLGL